MKDSPLRNFVEFLLDNLFDILTIVIAGYLVIRSQLQPPTANDVPNLATWILAVLALLAVSGLWERNRRLNRIEEATTETRELVQRKLSQQIKASDFFIAEKKLSPEIFSAANTVLLLGFSLARTIRDYHHVLGQRLAAGANVRVIMLDPDNEPLLQIVAQETLTASSVTASAEHWRNTIQTSVAFIGIIEQERNRKGKLELGYLPFPPAFGLIFIDPYESHGFCIVDIYHHKSTAPNASFRLSAANDPFWYNFYREQFESAWQSCKKKEGSKS